MPVLLPESPAGRIAKRNVKAGSTFWEGEPRGPGKRESIHIPEKESIYVLEKGEPQSPGKKRRPRGPGKKKESLWVLGKKGAMGSLGKMGEPQGPEKKKGEPRGPGKKGRATGSQKKERWWEKLLSMWDDVPVAEGRPRVRSQQQLDPFWH